MTEDILQQGSAKLPIDSLTGFLSGYSGKIYKTIDGGLNWSASLSIPQDARRCSTFPRTGYDF